MSGTSEGWLEAVEGSCSVAHAAGVRRLAMEALPWPADGTPGPIRAIPPDQGGYLAQPDMRRLIGTALDLGWSLWAYEALIKVAADTDPAELLSMEFTNWREREQARNLCQVRAPAPEEPLLVWCGNGHAGKEAVGDWIPMGWHFRSLSGTDPFVIDQTVSISFRSQSKAVGGVAAGLPRCDPGHPRRHRWDPE